MAAGPSPARPVRWIDLSAPTEPSPSEATPIEVRTLDHRDGAAVLGMGRLCAEDFPDGLAISNETVTLTTHSGTHVDAPRHYGPTTGDRPARTIDEVPLDWCHGPGVRVDVRHIPDGAEITADHVRGALAEIGHQLAPGDVVLLWTGADALWGTGAYLTDFPGLGAEATRFILGAGVRVIGTDAWGLDRPIRAMVDDYEATGDGSVLWPAHIVGRELEYLQLEKLAGLGELPGSLGFEVMCFPVRLMGAGASWARVVAAVSAPS
jgi:kynurenine formamidase